MNPSREYVANPVYSSIIPSGMLSPFFKRRPIGVVRLSPDLHQVSLSHKWDFHGRTWIVQPDLRFCLRRPYVSLAYIGDVFLWLLSGDQSELSIVSSVTRKLVTDTFMLAKGMDIYHNKSDCCYLLHLHEASPPTRNPEILLSKARKESAI